MTIRLLPLQLDPGSQPCAVGLVTCSYLLHEKTSSVLMFLHPLGTCWGDLVHTDIFNLKFCCTQASEDMTEKCTMNAELNNYFKGKSIVFCFFFLSQFIFKVFLFLNWSSPITVGKSPCVLHVQVTTNLIKLQ